MGGRRCRGCLRRNGSGGRRRHGDDGRRRRWSGAPRGRGHRGHCRGCYRRLHLHTRDLRNSGVGVIEGGRGRSWDLFRDFLCNCLRRGIGGVWLDLRGPGRLWETRGGSRKGLYADRRSKSGVLLEELQAGVLDGAQRSGGLNACRFELEQHVLVIQAEPLCYLVNLYLTHYSSVPAPAPVSTSSARSSRSWVEADSA